MKLFDIFKPYKVDYWTDEKIKSCDNKELIRALESTYVDPGSGNRMLLQVVKRLQVRIDAKDCSEDRIMGDGNKAIKE